MSQPEPAKSFIPIELPETEYFQRLVRGLIHKLNNVLTIYTGYGSLLRSGFNDQETLNEALDQFDSGSQTMGRLLKLVDQLATSVTPSPSPIDLAQEVESWLADPQTADGGPPPELDSRTEGPYPIALEHNSLRQVLDELLANARHNSDQAAAPAILRIRKDETRILLELQDHGQGITPERLQEMFVPFVTTLKSEGHLGLGLTMVYHQVTGVGGTVEVQTVVGQGTCVRLVFPEAQ